jgi:3-dehydroquinate dehydratase / shikimate dehydrogenase
MQSYKARICVPVCVRRAGDLANEVKRAAEIGDVVEIRFDCFTEDEIGDAIKEYARLRQTFAETFIITFRPLEEGGHRAISIDERIAFWERDEKLWNHERPTFDLPDIEFQLLSNAGLRNQLASDRIVCSHHDFASGPKELDQLYKRMTQFPVVTLKIAVQADDATDCIPVFNLIERARREGRELIAIAMGQAGVMTRILGPSRGSFLTYGSLDEDSTTAPGQVTARDLREVYRIDSIDRETQIMGVIGRPVAHSISPYIHNAALAQTNLNAVFIPFEVHDLDSFIRRMVRKSSREIEWNLRGIAVTAPHKSSVVKHLEWIEPAAKEIGAVNTIVVQDGGLHGYNTDAAGFIGPLNSRVGSLDGVRCAVIGAGGAARAVVWALRQERTSVTLFCRDPEKAKAIRDQFQVSCRPLADAAFFEFDIVVNATPLGTRGELETETPVTAEQLRGVRLAYDLVYNPLETQFMREARQAGCETVGGLEMLIAQAVEQFRLWTGKEPDVESMRDGANRALNNSGP